jgi:hypothetical protein
MNGMVRKGESSGVFTAAQQLLREMRLTERGRRAGRE